MFDMFGGNPDAVSFRAVVKFNEDQGHWQVVFALGDTAFWGVDFLEQTEPLDPGERWTMKQEATKMLAEEIKRRLSGGI
jgi:hypothetical protein